jgi:hypothetical protein
VNSSLVKDSSNCSLLCNSVVKLENADDIVDVSLSCHNTFVGNVS